MASDIVSLAIGHRLELVVVFTALFVLSLVPRVIRAITIIRNMVTIGGPDGDAHLIRLRNDPKVSSVAFAPMCGRSTHLIVDSSIIQRTFTSPLLDNHDAFHQIDVPIFGASSQWIGQRDAYEAAFDQLFNHLRAGGTNLLGENFAQAFEDELKTLSTQVPTGSIEGPYSETLGKAFALANSKSFLGPHDVEKVLKLYLAFDRQSHLFPLCYMLESVLWIPQAISRPLICGSGYKARTELQEYWKVWFKSEDFDRCPPVIRDSLLTAEEQGFNPQDMAALMIAAQFAILSNSLRTISWMIAHLIQSPIYMQLAREEITAYRERCKAEGVADVPPSSLTGRLPFLTSLLYETLRVDGSFFHLRAARENGRIESAQGRPPVVFKRKDFVISAANAANYDPDAHPDPHVFKADRFLSGGVFRTPEHILPFGGGPGICKGRSFVIFAEIRSVMRILELFDVELVRVDGPTREVLDGSGARTTLPQHTQGMGGTGTLLGASDYTVKLSARS